MLPYLLPSIFDSQDTQPYSGLALEQDQAVLCAKVPRPRKPGRGTDRVSLAIQQHAQPEKSERRFYRCDRLVYPS
jgi:hypothetical protein